MRVVAPQETAVGSVLFTDLVGFTEFNQTAGDLAALAVLEQQTRLMSACLGDRPQARIVKELGDGLLVWLATATDGLAVAAAMLTTVAEARRGDGFPLAIRMGLHHGEVLPRDDDVVGLTVNVAARIAALAGPGELLVSEAAIEGFEGRHDLTFEPVGPVPVKGVRDPVWLARASVSD